PRWPLPTDQAVTEELTVALSDVLHLSPSDDTPERAQAASDADVTIAIPQDVNPDLLEGLLQELPGQTEEFSAAIQRLLAGGTAEDLNVAQRIAHTVKGAGNTVGVKGIANLTHCLEDIFLALSQAEAFPTKRLGQSLMNAADCLEGMCEVLMQGGGAAPADALTVYQEILDWANYIDSKGLPTGEEGPEFHEARPAAPARKEAKNDAGDEAKTDTKEGGEAKEGGDAVAASIRVPATLVDELLRLGGENIILTGQVRERLNRASGQTRSMQEHFRMLQELGTELEQFIDITDLSANQRVASTQDKFDALEMDQYSELHTYSRRLVESATDAAEMGKNLLAHLRDLDNMLVNKERLNGDTQEAVMRTRMVAVKSIFPRLQRSVRQTCRLTGKQVDLRFSGGDTMMDSDVLNSMADPMMHLLRNAIDHGIEDEAGRLKAGKHVNGTLELAFMRDGNNILIRCKDDGHGLDFDAIREKAKSAGLISAEQAADEETLKRYILLPNFSTRKQVTQTSGRGIGLDAVNSKVEELGGSLGLDSKRGAGCTFDLRLPMTLISSHAVLVRMGKQVLAVANRGITQILHPDSGELRQFGEDTVFHVAGNSYPVKPLDRLLGGMVERRDDSRAGAYPMLMVQAGTGTTAIQVEAVIESRDLVVKGFGRYLTKIRGVIGATILGDGSVTPVLDLPELLRAPVEAGLRTQSSQTSSSIVRAGLPKVLVVDDSLSARRSLAQFMQDSGFEVRTARDGLEAIEVIEAVKPDILLVDMEMPRMNGIELTSYVRGAPALGNLPIIMITSRSTAKHREQATSAGVNAYLTKPFSEDELLAHVHRLRAPN
ncbi:MAG: response regulator, partial [Burkholderiales bacterium]